MPGNSMIALPPQPSCAPDTWPDAPLLARKETMAPLSHKILLRSYISRKMEENLYDRLYSNRNMKKQIYVRVLKSVKKI